MWEGSVHKFSKLIRPLVTWLHERFADTLVTLPCDLDFNSVRTLQNTT